jgi:transcriptional regulator with XRE-family HTH domain
MKTLGQRLEWARKVAKLSQRGLARRAGLGSQRHVGLIESGERDNPELKTLQKVADTLGVSIGWLANGEGERPTAETIRATVGEPDHEDATEPAA